MYEHFACTPDCCHVLTIDRVADKDVHKANSLDLVGWFTLTTPSGPAPNHLHIHEHLLAHHNDSTLLLAFHPSIAADAASRNGKLPLSVYESHYETASNAPDNHDKAMRDAATSTTEASSEVLPKIRFRQLPYTIETGEAEMIAVDFVARGGANATAIRDAAPSAPRAPRPTSAAGSDDVAQSKGKPRAKSSDASDALGSAAPAAVHVTPLMLSTEDDDAIASLMARANAVRMLRQRLALMRAYVASLPPGYLTEPDAAPPHRMAPDTRVSHPVLRSIASLLARLPLLSLECAPADGNVPAAAAIPPTTLQERDAAAADAALVGLLGAMGGTLRGATEMGQRAGIVEAARTNPSMSSGRGSGFMPLVGAGGAAGRDPGTPVYS